MCMGYTDRYLFSRRVRTAVAIFFGAVDGFNTGYLREENWSIDDVVSKQVSIIRIREKT